MNSTTRIYVIDGNSGETIWYSELSVDASNRISVEDGILYHALFDKYADADTIFLIKTSVSTMNWDTIYKVHRDDPYLNGGSPFISMPITYTSDSGIDYLISSVGAGGTIAFPYISFLRAYNKKTGEFEWTTEESGQDPRLHQNKIYSFSGGYIKCFNPENGDLIWEQLVSSLAGEWVQMEHCLTFHENYVLVKTMGELFMAFDTETGDKLWENAFKSHGPDGGLHVYQDKVYFMGTGYGRIQGAYIATGELFMDWKSPNRDEFSGASFSWSGVDVDTESGYLYVSDKYYMMCLDLNKIEE